MRPKKTGGLSSFFAQLRCVFHRKLHCLAALEELVQPLPRSPALSRALPRSLALFARLSRKAHCHCEVMLGPSMAQSPPCEGTLPPSARKRKGCPLQHGGPAMSCSEQKQCRIAPPKRLARPAPAQLQRATRGCEKALDARTSESVGERCKKKQEAYIIKITAFVGFRLVVFCAVPALRPPWTGVAPIVAPMQQPRVASCIMHQRHRLDFPGIPHASACTCHAHL